MFLKQSVIYNDTYITKNDDTLEKRIKQNDKTFHLDSSLLTNPSRF